LPSAVSEPPHETSGSTATALERRLVLVLGKGGVGKSTLAAALAKLRAARGETVLLCEVNAHNQLAGLLGVPPTGPDIERVGDSLFLCNLTPDAALHQYAVMKLKVERVVKRLLANRVVRHFLRLLPSLPEIVTLGKLLYHVKEERNGRPRFDAVILDAPATGHGLSLLRVPQSLLASIPEGPLREDMTWMNALLVDPKITAAALVTLCEELPVNETLELNAALRDELRIPRGLCVANGLWPDRFTPAELEEVRAKAPRSAAMVAERFAAEAEGNRVQLAHLRTGLGLPVAELPLIFDAPDGAHLTRQLEIPLLAALSTAGSSHAARLPTRGPA
jgi:energy-coupling factor transporter ATP-binding protein EcfA2